MALKSTTNSAAEPMIWILTVSACLISLGLNVYLIWVVQDQRGWRERCHATEEARSQMADEASRLRREIAVLVKKLCIEINELRARRDAHGRFTR